MKILVADDELAMQKIISLYLIREGYTVKTVSDGLEALNVLCEEYFDLAILDWMMPGLEGIDVCKQIKALNIKTKLIVLTARTQTEDEILGLKYGADDYIKKPFEPEILLLRIKKLLKVEEVLSCKNLQLNLNSQKVVCEARELSLSKKEYELLEYFMKNQGIVLTRDVLLNNIWGIWYEGDDRTLDTHIKRLRAKIGKDYIKTHRGLGYCME